MIQASKAHLESAGEEYSEHLAFATTVGMLSIGAGIACLIHAVVPALCTGTASRTIRRITILLGERERLSETREQSRELLAFLLLLVLAAVVVAPLWLFPVAGVIRVTYSALAFAIPLTMLVVNSELENEDPILAPLAT